MTHHRGVSAYRHGENQRLYRRNVPAAVKGDENDALMALVKAVK